MRILGVVAVLFSGVGFAAVPTEAEINQQRRACEKQLSACARLSQMRAEVEAVADAERERIYLRQKATDEKMRAEALDAIAAEQRVEEAKSNARKLKCGKDFNRVRVGMRFSRLRECTGDIFDVVEEDLRGAVYESPGGAVRVEKGVVVKWVAR